MNQNAGLQPHQHVLQQQQQQHQHQQPRQHQHQQSRQHHQHQQQRMFQQQPPPTSQQGQSYPNGGQAPFQPTLPYKGTLAPGTKVQVGTITVTVKRYLSEGGFAHVYLVTTAQPIPMPTSVDGATAASVSSKATGIRGETTHVLKRMAVPDKESLADVRREVEVHKVLRNQANIVHFIEASATALQGGGYEVFILMEYCSGGGIIDLMNARLRDRLREEEVLKIFGDVCGGVAVMHHQDPPLMHRDLKVENILMSPSVGPDSIPGSRSTSSNLKATFKLCDFGSAAPVLSRRAPKSMDEVKRVEADLNKHTTLQYRAPEMVDVYQRRVIDEKADIWALGVFLYKLCYYTTPFEENGGGPLAILNVQYRFPPQPVYSQRLKDLIASLLIEQSTDRPTIDQVIISVHKIRGTRPPSSVLHYAQQAASGKISAPLPAIVGGSHGAEGVDVADLVGRTRTSKVATASSEADLISIGPSPKEREEAEARQLALQTGGITPMRRGRPAKASAAQTSSASSAVPVALSGPRRAAPPGRMVAQLTGESKAPVSQTSANGPASSGKQGAPSGFNPSTAPGDGFGDSFKPAISPPASMSLSPASSKTSTPAPTFTMSNTPASPTNLPPRPQNSAGSPAPHLLRPLHAASPSPASGSPGVSPFRHSPALPGFSATNSPAASPIPRQNGTSSMQQQRQLVPSYGDSDGAAGRFPSVEELDARYDSPSPVPSPVAPTTSSASVKASLQIPGLSNRASVGALAGRFNKANTVDATPQSSSAGHQTTSTATGNVLKRWQPLSSGTVPPSDLSKAPVASPKPTKPASYNDPTSRPAKEHTNGNLSSKPPYRHSMPVPRLDASASLTKSKSKPRDWLTGDDASEDEAKHAASLNTTDRGTNGANDRISAGQGAQSSYRSSERFDTAPEPDPTTINPATQPTGDEDDLSSDEEASMPEDPDARRPEQLAKRAGRAEEPQILSADEASSESGEPPVGRLKPARSQPGRLTAPPWLVDERKGKDIKTLPKLETSHARKDTLEMLSPSSHQTPLTSAVSPTKSEMAVNEKLDEAAREAEKKLEELLRGPEASTQDESLTSKESNEPIDRPMEELVSPPLPSRARAPAWDDDEDEMHSLPKPDVSIRYAAQQANTGELGALQADARHNDASDRVATESSAEQRKWLHDLMDEAPEEPTSNLTAALPSSWQDRPQGLQAVPPSTVDSAAASKEQRKHYVDAATSPCQSGSLATSPTSVQLDQILARFGDERGERQMGEGATPSVNPPAQVVDAATRDGTPAKTSADAHLTRPDPSKAAIRTTSTNESQAQLKPALAAKPSWHLADIGSKPSLVQQRQQSFVSDQADARPSTNSKLAASSAGPPKVIMPKPTALRPANSSYAQKGSLVRPAPISSRGSDALKPWEREAAAAAEISKAGLVRSSTNIRGGGAAQVDGSSDTEEEPESASRNGSPERFGGVSSLISRWQQNVESQAPGWGRVGANGAPDGGYANRRSTLAGQGRGLGPKVASEAAASIQGRKGTADGSSTRLDDA